MPTVETLLTAEEFGHRPDPGYPEELVRGRIVVLPWSDPRGSALCTQIGQILGDFIEIYDLGRLIGNRSGVIVERDPDTVRGPDVAFCSFARLPRGPLSDGYGPEIPELIVEVRSAEDRWGIVQRKVGEYFAAGVLTVVVLDPDTQTASIFRADAPPQTLTTPDRLTLPEVLEGFAVRVANFSNDFV